MTDQYLSGTDLASDQATAQREGGLLASGPLKDLFTSKYNYKLLQYPADLNSSGKGHSIIFDVYNVHSTSMEQVGEAWSVAKKEVISAVSNPEKFANDINIAAQNTSLEGTLDTIKTSIAKFQVPKKDYQTTVSLYMPDTLSFGYDVGYDGQTTLASAASSVPFVGAIARAATGVLDNQAAKLALRQFGYAFNPQAQMLFDNINFRTYPMTFTFTPRSAQEAAKVHEIIQTFRKHAAPTIVNASAGFFFKPPSIFNVSFWSDGKENTNINKILDSVIENVEVNYAPNGWSAHKDGAPVQITMTLSFKEIVLVDRNKIENGY